MKEKKYQLAKRTKFNVALLPAIQNLVSLGCTESDIGVILGYSGKDAREFLKGLKRRNQDVRVACEIGRNMANIALVSKAWELAVTGYNYIETETTYKIIDGKKVETEVKTKEHHNRPNTALLQTLLRSRLPRDFSQKLQIDKRTLNIDMDSEDEVNSFFGNLENSRKVIESEEIEVETDEV